MNRPSAPGGTRVPRRLPSPPPRPVRLRGCGRALRLLGVYVARFEGPVLLAALRGRASGTRECERLVGRLSHRFFTEGLRGSGPALDTGGGLGIGDGRDTGGGLGMGCGRDTGGGLGMGCGRDTGGGLGMGCGRDTGLTPDGSTPETGLTPDGPIPETGHGLPMPASDRPVLLLLRHSGPFNFQLGALLACHVLDRGLLGVGRALPGLDPAVGVLARRLRVDLVRWNESGPARAMRLLIRHARDMGPGDALAYFPEGANMTAAGRRRVLAELAAKDPERARWARELRYVLPPVSAGAARVLALAGGADVLVVGHTGLEDLVGGVVDIGYPPPAGPADDRRIHLTWWHTPAEDVPREPAAAAAWLDGQWAAMDRWIADRRGAPDETPDACVSPSPVPAAPAGEAPPSPVPAGEAPPSPSPVPDGEAPPSPSPLPAGEASPSPAAGASPLPVPTPSPDASPSPAAGAPPPPAPRARAPYLRNPTPVGEPGHD